MPVSPLDAIQGDSPIMQYKRVEQPSAPREQMGFVEAAIGQQKQNLIPKVMEHMVPDATVDPDWENPVLTDERVPFDYRVNFAGARNQEDYDQTMERLQSELDWSRKVSNASTGGKIGALLSGMADPALLGAIPFEEVAIGGKILQMGRLARMMRGSATLGVSAGLTEAALVGASETKPWEDVLTATVAGAMFGGGLGAFRGTTKMMMSPKAVKAASDAAEAEMTRSGYLPEIFSDEFFEAAEATAQKNASSGFVDKTVKWSMGERGRKSKSGVFAEAMRRFTDSSGTGGKFTRHNTAAVERELDYRIMASKYTDFWDHYTMWSKESGYGIGDRWLHGEGREKFGREVMEELDFRANNAGETRNTNKAVDAVCEMSGNFYKENLNIIQRAGVEGAENVAENPYYYTRKWQYHKMLAVGKKNFVKLLSKGLVGGYSDMAPHTATSIARKVFDRLKRKASEAVEPDIARFDEAQLDTLDEIFAEVIPDIETREKMLGMITKGGTKGKAPGHLKQRLRLDMNVTDDEGRTLWDFLDTDLGQHMNTRAAMDAGRAAMARQGIRSDADWTKLKAKGYKVLEQHPEMKAEIDKDWDRLVAVRRQLLGQSTYSNPNSTYNRLARDLMDLTHLSTMGQMGIAQFTELANLFGENGLANVIHAIPQMKRVRKAMENNPELAADFNAMSWATAPDHKMMVPHMRTDEGLMNVEGTNNAVRSARNAMSEGKRLMNYASLQNSVMTTERDLWLHSTYIRFFDHAQGKRPISVKRLNDMGISPDLNNAIRMEIRNHGKLYEKEGIKSLGMQHWDEGVRRDFQIAMSRQMNQAIQGTLAGELPLWATTSFGRIIAQFRNFPLVAFTKQTKRLGKLADAQAFQTIAYGSMISMAVHYGRVQLNAAQKTGRKKQEYLDRNLSAAGLAHGLLRYLPVASVAPDGVNMTANLLGYDIGQPYRGGQSVASNMAIGNFAASGGYLTNIVGAAKGGIHAMTGEYDNHDARALMSIMPYSNVLGVKQGATAFADMFKDNK